MFKNHPRPARRTFNKSTTKKGPRGSFENNQWLCDCSPRLPAEHFQVKKEGQNKGRWFYTCQKHENERCGFFLWQEDAEPRMKGAVLGNSHTEPIIRSKEEAPKQDNAEPQPKRGKKRTLPWEVDSNKKAGKAQQDISTEDDSFGLSDGDEVALSRATAAAGRNDEPETPRKVQKTTQFETPTSKILNGANIRNGMPTPGTTPAPKTVSASIKQQQAYAETPTPARKKDALADEEPLSDKAFKLLGLFDVKLGENAANALRGLLDSEARKWQGVVKGRDTARAAVQSRDMRIAELLDSISRIEGENEANKALIAHLKTKR